MTQATTYNGGFIARLRKGAVVELFNGKGTISAEVVEYYPEQQTMKITTDGGQTFRMTSISNMTRVLH